MKKIIIVAALAFVSFGVNAQNNNQVPEQDKQIRQAYINSAEYKNPQPGILPQPVVTDIKTVVSANISNNSSAGGAINAKQETKVESKPTHSEMPKADKNSTLFVQPGKK